MNTISKLRRIVVYDHKDIPFNSIPLDGSMTIDTLNNILDALSQVMPSTFTLRLE